MLNELQTLAINTTAARLQRQSSSSSMSGYQILERWTSALTLACSSNVSGQYTSYDSWNYCIWRPTTTQSCL